MYFDLILCCGYIYIPLMFDRFEYRPDMENTREVVMTRVRGMF